MAERQVHGFKFEISYIIENGLVKESSYTSKFDARDNAGVPYQIKLIKKNSSIDLGDYFRNSEAEESFFLVIAFWENEKDNIVEVHKLFIPKNDCRKLFFFEEQEKLKNWITNEVSNSYSYDEQWKEEMKFWKEKFGNRKVALRFKRDHKNQRRIQCAINKTNFYSYFIKRYSIAI